VASIFAESAAAQA